MLYWWRGLLFCGSIVFFVGCDIRAEPLTIWHTSNLAAEKIEWAQELAQDIEAASGIHVNVKRRPLLLGVRAPWLELCPEDFKNWKDDTYATISLENEIGAWLQSTLGIHWLAPGEVEWDGTAPEMIPFAQWVNGPERAEQKTFLRRHLLGADRGKQLRWSQLNGLYPQRDRSHTHYKIIRPEQFDTHPELFAKDAEGRPMRPPHPVPNQYNDHPDLLEPKVVDRIAKAAIEAFREDPLRKDFSILPNDSYVFSHIPESNAELRPNGYYNELRDYSNYVYQFANRVAVHVAEKFPDKYLLSGAYMNWLNVPDFPLHPMLTVNIADDRTQWYDPEYKQRDLELIDEWTETDMSLIGATDYVFGAEFMIPRSLSGIVGESIPTFYEKGLRRYRGFVGPLWGYDAHTTWLAAQMTWDVSQDPEELLKEFFRLYYGPAAQPMREFFDTAERIWMKQPGKGSWLRYWKDPHQAALYGDKELAELEQWLAEAEVVSRGSAKSVSLSLSGSKSGGGLEEPLSRSDPDSDFDSDNDWGSRFVRRVGYTRDLFEMTKRFVEIVHLRWALSIGEYDDFEAAYRPFDLGKLDLGSEKGVRATVELLHAREEAFKAEVDRLVAKTHLHSRLRLTEWIFEDDPSSRALERTGPTRPAKLSRSGEGPTHWATLFSGWEGWGKTWRVSLLDTEDAEVELKGEFVEARNVFRGFLHRSARAEPGKRYRALVPIEGQVGPSSFIYVRLDFYDAEFNSLDKSKWDRLPPGTYNTPFEVGPVMEAPDESAYVRLYIRLFHQEHGDWLRIHSPQLNESQ